MLRKIIRWLLILLIIVMLNTQTMISLQTNVNEENKNIEKISLSYKFNEPTYTNVILYGEEYTRINIDNLPISNKEGEPSIPIKPLKILLPESTNADSIVLEASESKTFENNYSKSVELGLKTQSLSQQTFEIEDQTIIPKYDKYVPYPSKLYKNLGVQYLRGYAILNINLYPVQYDGEKNTFIFYDEIRINIELIEEQSNQLFRNDSYKDIEKMVENPEILNTYQSEKKGFFHSSNNYDYIIITTDDLINTSGSYNFDDLIDYRTNQGLSCRYKTIEDIKAQYTGVDTQEKIRNFIKYAYMNWGTTWILLGGDVEKVPIRYLHDIDGRQSDETEMTSDLYYQCLDGNYNDDGDNIWGEQYDGVDGGEIDLFAEVYIGRAPVDDGDDISAFVEKTLSYENSNWGVDDYLSRHLSAGEYAWSGPGGWGSGYVERCIDYCADYDQETYGIPSSTIQIIELYERDEDWTHNDAMNQVNNGAALINHVGHGSCNAAMKIAYYDVISLDNEDKYGLFYSQACHSGQLEIRDECIAEAWVNTEKRGGFAAIMNTGYGYGSTSDYNGADNRYAREFFDALFSPHEEISRIGKANQDSKEDNYYRLDERNMYHGYYDTLLFGDPYVQIKGAEDTKADFSWSPKYPLVGEYITFNDLSTGHIIYQEWDFGDGGFSLQKNPTHSFRGEGIYQVKFSVIDIQGYMSTITQEVEVRAEWMPIAIASPEYYYGYNFTVNFKGEDSWDPDGVIVSYQWNFGDETTSTLQNPVHEFQLEGSYYVRFSVVDDDDNMDTVFCEIILEEQFPPLKPDKPTGPSEEVFIGENHSYTVVATDPENDKIQYGWDWGDGNSIQWSEYYNSGEPCTMSHNWMSQGDYQIRVRARDNHSAMSNWSDPLIVTTKDGENPILQIVKPEKGLYIANNKISSFFTIFAIGALDFEVIASDASGISRVQFFVNGRPIAEVNNEPYNWTWNRLYLFRYFHNVEVVAYDNAGRYSTESIKILKIL